MVRGEYEVTFPQDHDIEEPYRGGTFMIRFDGKGVPFVEGRPLTGHARRYAQDMYGFKH